VTRVCFVSRVRPDRLDEYRARHAAVWPEMLEALRDTGWRDYSLYLAPDGLLVGHLETDDYAAAQEAMTRTAVNPRWQAEMAEFFVTDGNPDEGFQVLDEVFHLEDQLRAAGLPTTPSTARPPHAGTAGPADDAAPRPTTTDPARLEDLA
jgi:L-rhamnose mutarotase